MMELKSCGIQIYLRIAEEIRKEILEGNSEKLLPSVDALGRRFGVSTRTILKAVRILSEKGLLQTHPGKRTVIVRPGEAEGDSVPVSSCFRIYGKIRDDIASGAFRAGHFLPTVKTFEFSEKVSDKTVCEALRLLEKENLIHKEGRKWVVGPKSSQTAVEHSSMPFSERPMVLVLWPSFIGWIKESTQPHKVFFPFLQAFSHELERHSIAIVHGYTDAAEVDSSFPKGMDDVLPLVSRNKERYMGALLCNYSATRDRKWVKELGRFKKPVICAYMSNPPALKESDPCSVFCVCNERAAAKHALDALVNRGHRVIGMLHAYGGPDLKKIEWVTERIRMIQELASKYYPDVTIVVGDQREEYWNDQKWRRELNLFMPFLTEHARCSAPEPAQNDLRGIVSYRETIQNTSPGLWELVNYPGLTAIIAANDMRARLLSIWLKEVGIPVPGRISLIGFDNDLESYYHQISTVDFGLGKVGYLAAHTLIGYIPTIIGRNRILESAPIYIDRGSVGTGPRI